MTVPLAALEPTRIRVLLTHERNRELVADWLDDDYEVRAGLDDVGEPAHIGTDDDVSGVGTALAGTDLCLVDEAGFAAHRERLAAWKDRADPVFAPVLLVTEDAPSEDLDPEAWETLDGLYVVDDMVQIPVEKAVFARRLENLLSRRKLSTNLTRSYRRSEERFSSLFNGTPDPAFVVTDREISYANDALCALCEGDREAVVGTALADAAWLPAATLEALSTQRETALAGGDPDPETVVVEPPDGGRRYVEANVKALTGGDVEGVVVVMRDVTERREREREIAEREAQFRAVFEGTNDALLVADDEGTYVDTNPAACDLLGLSKDEVVGQSVGEFMPDSDGLADTWERFLADGQMRGTFELVRDDGERRVVEFSAQTDVQPGRHLSALRDVTERTRMERELRQSERRFRQIAEHVEEVIWMVSPDDESVVYVSPSFADLTGRSAGLLDDGLFDGLATIVHPGDREAVLGKAEAMLADGRADDADEEYAFAFRVERPDGETRWVEATGYPVVDEDGAVSRFVGIIDDRTDAMRRERRFRAVFDQTYQFTGLLDPDGEIVDVNDAVVSEGPIDAADVVGEPLPAAPWWPDEEARERVADAVATAAEGAVVRSQETVLNGEGRATIDFSITPVTDETGEIDLLVAEGRDVTDLVERERELERKNERLSEFAGIVSHDLRNPLQVFAGRLAQLAEDRERADSPADVPLDEHLPSMERSVDRMQTLVDDLLTLASQDAALSETRPVGLADLAREAWTTTDAPEATLAVATDRTVRADPSRLQQVLENCFRNAVDHGPGDVTVTVGDLDDHEGFFVADDGPGIPEAERDAIFEQGYSTDPDGTGFGLGIVSEVAAAHGWTVVVVESETGGARFEFRGVASPGRHGVASPGRRGRN